VEAHLDKPPPPRLLFSASLSFSCIRPLSRTYVLTAGSEILEICSLISSFALMAEVPSRPGPGQARELVESISKKLGFVPEHRWAALTPEARQDFKDAFELKDSMIFTSVST
jgi:hypothetical protein